MCGLGLENILLFSILNQTGDSFIVYSRISPRIFIQLGLKLLSDREDFLVEMYILLSLVLFEQKWETNKIIDHMIIAGPCIILAPDFDWLQSSTISVFPAWDIPKSVHDAY